MLITNMKVLIIVSKDSQLNSLCDLIKNSGFKAIKFKRAEFTSYHGRKRPGMMIIAQKI